MKLKRVLFVPDTHRPYHDKRACKLVMNVAKDVGVDCLVIGGDYADFYSVSSHSRNPNRARNLEYEVDSVNEGLDEFDALKPGHKIFIAGNHEDRLERYLQDKAPELFNMVKIEKLFKLKERGWDYIPYKDHVRIGKLYVTHDTGKAGKFAHYSALEDFQHSVVINHTHRMGYAVVGNASGAAHVGAMFGWLGDSNQVDYMHRIKAKRDWALGFGFGYLDPSNGNVYLDPVPIVNYTCVVNGKLYKA